jgi:hypothetical protein
MNVATMEVDYSSARDAYRHYRQAIKSNQGTKDDKALALAYHALMRGRKVIDIGLSIADAGTDAAFRPRLAVARADWTRVFSRRDDDGKFRFTSRSSNWGRRPHGEVAVRIGETPRWSSAVVGGVLGEGQAQVPSIPPQFRPVDALSNYHVLFEAEWLRVPPVDPMLLQRVGGAESPFFVVLAAWDLSPLEQAVLRTKL